MAVPADAEGHGGPRAPHDLAAARVEEPVMRSTSLLGAVTLALAAAGAARAQGPRDLRTVTLPEAEVRSGPSDSPQFYVTNRLRAGTPVEVLQELDGGWLKVRPPEGSFSWVNTRFLEHIVPHQPNWVVSAEGVDVPVFMGSEVVKGRTVVGAKLKRGAQVTSVGPSRTDEEGTWLPSQPPPGEGRYGRAVAVARRPAPNVAPPARTASKPGGSLNPPAAGPVAPSPAPSAGPKLPPGTLYLQGEHAERSGQIAEAIRLYALAASEASASNPLLAADALRRAQYLQGAHHLDGAASTQTRLVPPGAPPAPPPPARLPPPSTFPPTSREGAAPPPAPAGPAPPARWPAYSGRLRRSGRCLESQRTYVLEKNNYPAMYL